MAKLYAISGAPSTGAPSHPMSAQEIAERANLPIDLVQKRLTRQGLRDWPSLSRSAAEASRIQVQKMRRQMSVERMCMEEERDRAAAHTRINGQSSEGFEAPHHPCGMLDQ